MGPNMSAKVYKSKRSTFPAPINIIWHNTTALEQHSRGLMRTMLQNENDVWIAAENLN